MLCFHQDAPDWTEILTHFRGSELQNYFTKILEDDMKAIIKPQYVDQIPRAIKVGSANNNIFFSVNTIVAHGAVQYNCIIL